MKAYSYLTIIGLLSACLLSCKKDSKPKTGTTSTTGTTGKTDTIGKVDTVRNAPPAGVYLVGTIAYNATIWRVGAVPITLSAKNSGAAAFTTQGKDIYTAGYDFLDGKTIACYWKNNNIIRLTFGGESSASATAIAVQGNDVYVTAGLINATEYTVAQIAYCYKNGVGTVLPSPANYTYATGVVVKGNDVYVSGYYINSVTGEDYYVHACYWKNGVLNILDSTENRSTANGIAVTNNSDVYVVGSNLGSPNFRGKNNTNDPQRAVCWKNGTPATLPTNLGPGSAAAITIKGNDVYIAGTAGRSSDTTNAVYWKNGSLIVIPDAKNASAIAVSGNDVYVTGGKQVTGTTDVYPGCWKNGAVISVQAYSSFYNGVMIIP